jgi:drug/metabolite transporter (DMT)-like permease
MPLSVFGIVLFGAALHASWNALVKDAGDKLLTMAEVTVAAGLLAALALPALRPPAPASWPFIAGSVVLQVLFYVLVAVVYAWADMGRAYPLMRGAAPLLVSAFGALILGERLPAAAWAGIGTICLGIFSLAAGSPRGHRKGMALALATAVVIAAYTLVDGVGVRRSGAPVAYTLWIFLLTAPPFALWAATARKADLVPHLAANWARSLTAGVGTLGSYTLALWAMTLAPVAVVAALRETSILFGTALAALVLKERLGPARIAAACLVAAGAVALRLA